MRRILLCALVPAVLAFPAWTPAPASAAVGLHTYAITSGSSYGTLDIGTITGGGYKINFPAAPCAGTPVLRCSGFGDADRQLGEYHVQRDVAC